MIIIPDEQECNYYLFERIMQACLLFLITTLDMFNILQHTYLIQIAGFPCVNPQLIQYRGFESPEIYMCVTSVKCFCWTSFNKANQSPQPIAACTARLM